jgi:hypothetical protein
MEHFETQGHRFEHSLPAPTCIPAPLLLLPLASIAMLPMVVGVTRDWHTFILKKLVEHTALSSSPMSS